MSLHIRLDEEDTWRIEHGVNAHSSSRIFKCNAFAFIDVGGSGYRLDAKTQYFRTQTVGISVFLSKKNLLTFSSMDFSTSVKYRRN